jgi:hypothetical protein
MDRIEQVTDGKPADDTRSLTSIYKHGTDLVRVRVVRNCYEYQSFAVAEVMSGDRKWTELTHAPRDQWWAYTANPKCTLDVIADDLAARAAKILDA